MKKYLVPLVVCAGLLAGCSSSEKPLAKSPTPKAPLATKTPAKASVPESMDEAILAVNKFTSSGQYDKAVELATASLEKYPESYALLVNRGAVLLAQEKHEKALNDFESALKFAPEEAKWTVVSQKARCQMGLGQKASAEKSFAEAVELMKKAPEVSPVFAEQLWRLRGNNLAGDLRHKEAIPCYTETLKVDPKSLKALAGRALAYSALKDQKKFEADLVALDKLQPGAGEAVREEAKRLASPEYAQQRLLGDGIGKLRARDYKGALAEFDRVLAKEPRNGQAHQKRGSALQSLKRYEEAVKAYSKSLEIQGDEVSLFNRAICYLNLKKTAESKADLEKFIEVSKSPAEIETAKTLLESL